jgi:saccharopine dehydrogenase (NAD+, L-lysine forming)
MPSRPVIGIRHEDKNRWERRAPLAPEHVRVLVEQHGVDVVVEPSPMRVFDDAAYQAAGARLAHDLSQCPVVLGVKEIPIAKLAAEQAYIYFAHVIKGQPYNMPMLRALLDRRCHLFDYEKVTDAKGRRLVFFGRYAGLAGMLDTLWSLGQRLALDGLHTPFSEVRRAFQYRDLDQVRDHLREIAGKIRRDGLPDALVPCVIGLAGYGNVSQGAQEVLAQLPTVEVSPEQLLAGDFGGVDLRRTLVKVVFKEQHMAVPVASDQRFELQDYYQHPEKYRGDFDRFVDRLSVLVNCIYWDKRYPRLLTRAAVRERFASGQPRLRAVGDISCDIEGGIEVTLHATDVDNPCFVYDPAADNAVDGLTGRGLVVMAIDNLPCELPADATRSFGDVLTAFAPALARADYRAPLAELAVPDELRRALVVFQGQLTPAFEYLQAHLDAHGRG